MSGFFGQIVAAAFGGNSQQAQQALPALLNQVLGSSGGLQGLLGQLQNAGLGNQVQSWVGTGANAAVSPQQLGAAFSPEQVQEWATKAGTTPDAVMQILAEALPHTVDHATPAGRMPDAGAPLDLNALLGQFLGKR